MLLVSPKGLLQQCYNIRIPLHMHTLYQCIYGFVSVICMQTYDWMIFPKQLTTSLIILPSGVKWRPESSFKRIEMRKLHGYNSNKLWGIHSFLYHKGSLRKLFFNVNVNFLKVTLVREWTLLFYRLLIFLNGE